MVHERLTSMIFSEALGLETRRTLSTIYTLSSESYDMLSSICRHEIPCIYMVWVHNELILAIFMSFTTQSVIGSYGGGKSWRQIISTSHIVLSCTFLNSGLVIHLQVIYNSCTYLIALISRSIGIVVMEIHTSQCGTVTKMRQEYLFTIGQTASASHRRERVIVVIASGYVVVVIWLTFGTVPYSV